MLRSLSILSTCAIGLWLSACSQSPATTNQTGSPDASQGARSDTQDPASDAAAADALLRARAAAQAGQWDEGFTALDTYLELRPKDPAGWQLLAELSMASAPTNARPQLIYRDAATAFARAIELGGAPRLAFQVSRASRLCPDAEGALRWAEQALGAVQAPTAEEYRIAAEAYFDAYVAKKQAGEDPGALAAATQQQLEAHLAAAERESLDRTWGRDQLANFFEWQGDVDAARRLRIEAVEARPDDEAAHLRLITFLRQNGGFEAAAAYYDGFRATHPDHPLATWFEANERFERGYELYSAGQDGSAWFEDAERLFRTARELAPDWQQRCIAFELVCRSGTAYSKMSVADESDDAALSAAEEIFFSMEDIAPGGLDANYEGRLRSGAFGLQLLAEKGNRTEGNNLVGPALDRAARIYRRLHEARPDNATYANNCGYFHREIGVALAQKARAGGAGAEAAAQAARATLAICRDSYLAAARLAPEDVRIVNDAALILLYHYPSRLEEAEQLLLRAKAQGEEQLKNPDLDPEVRDQLTEAYGDAHQNLGLLALVYRSDPDRAEPLYRRAIEIGPPRAGRGPETEHILAACAALRRGETTPPEIIDPRIWLAE